jgi:hypothetical protein
MPIEEFHPDLLWVANNYPKIKTASGKGVGWGKKRQCVSRARVIGTLYMYEHLHEPINTLVMFFVPIPILTENPQGIKIGAT